MGEKVKSKETSNSPVKWNIAFFRKYFRYENQPIFVVEIHPFSGLIFVGIFLKNVSRNWEKLDENGN